ERAVGRRAEGTFQAAGLIDYRHPEMHCEGNISFTNLALADLLETTGVARELARRLSARVDGGVEVSGPLRTPSGHFELSGAALAVDGSPLGALALKGGFGDGPRRFFGSVSTRAKRGRIDASATFFDDARLELEAALDDVALE